MNILLSIAGRKTNMVKYFRDALKGKGKVFASNKEMTYALSQADGYLVTPTINDDFYIDILLQYCKSNDISVIIPLSDFDLPVLSKNKVIFKQNNISVIVSNEQVIRICADKWETYRFLTSIGFKQPKTYINKKIFKQDIQNGKILFPIYIKPRWGTELKAITQIETLQELELFYKKVFMEIFNSDIKYASQENENTCIIMQETVSGEEFGLDILNDLNGNYVTVIAKRKLVVRAGITNMTEIVDAAAFVETAKQISSNLKHVADLDTDCFLTDSGDIIILEMNARIGRLYSFAHIAGIDLPGQIIEWLEGNPTSTDLIVPEVGVKGSKESAPIVRILF